MANGRIKINELPETTLIEDNDIFIIENDTTTQKVSLGSLINYIKEHEEIVEYFVKQSAVDSENGVAPLDSNKKIPSANLPFGSTENTVYNGALGQALSDNLSLHLSDTANPHAVTKSQIGLSDVDNTSDIAKPVSTLQQNAIDIAYASSNAYTDAKIAELIDGAPSTLDTLGEIAQSLQEGGGISDALDAAIGSKASQAELDSHTGNDTIHITASERASWNSKMGNTEDAGNTTITFSEAADLSNISSGEKTGSIMGKISKAISTLISHIPAKATADTFGHVRLSDTYQNAVADGAAIDGVGASQKALADTYSTLNESIGLLKEDFDTAAESLQAQINNVKPSLTISKSKIDGIKTGGSPLLSQYFTGYAELITINNIPISLTLNITANFTKAFALSYSGTYPSILSFTLPIGITPQLTSGVIYPWNTTADIQCNYIISGESSSDVVFYVNFVNRLNSSSISFTNGLLYHVSINVPIDYDYKTNI